MYLTSVEEIDKDFVQDKLSHRYINHIYEEIVSI